MPDEITYNPNFIVKHPIKKNIARILATAIIIIVFSLLWIFVKDDTRVLFLIFILLAVVLFLFSLSAFSFKCSVTENSLKSSYWGLFAKQIQWSDVQCIKVIEHTGEKSVIIAIYNENGKSIMDFNTDMDNTWYVVKMAEAKKITVNHEQEC